MIILVLLLQQPKLPIYNLIQFSVVSILVQSQKAVRVWILKDVIWRMQFAVGWYIVHIGQLVTYKWEVSTCSQQETTKWFKITRRARFLDMGEEDIFKFCTERISWEVPQQNSYLEFNERETKTRSGNNPRNVRGIAPKMCAVPNNKKCPVKAYKVYAEKWPAGIKTNDAPFYLAVNNVKSGSVKPWFKKAQVGVNKLNTLMKTMAPKAGLRPIFKNHSGRKTVIQINFSQQRRAANWYYATVRTQKHSKYH